MKTNHRRGYKANTQCYKGGTAFSKKGLLSDKSVHAMADFDFTDGNRGWRNPCAAPRKTSIRASAITRTPPQGDWRRRKTVARNRWRRPAAAIRRDFG